ncbi:acyl-CoA thioesterase [Paenarthrobacter sp. NPDC089989]|uniref:acyl-CoA thioesterase n=1 Tax=unclassified Paenarthrobacter TaxID=2634190 RepID=UPI003830A2A1
MTAPLTREYRAALGDVDAAGVIYFAAVFRWHEAGLSEWLIRDYEPLSHILAKGFGLPVVACSADYSDGIALDDLLQLTSRVSEIGTTSFVFETTITREGSPACSVRTKHVWTHRTDHDGFRSLPLPQGLRQSLEASNGSKGS